MPTDWWDAVRAALLDPAAPIPPGVTSHNAARPARRFGVHRTNVLVSLVEALRARFPVAARISGDAFFREVARRFVLRSPPRSPVLLDYGEALPDFVEPLDAISALPYWPDILRLEVAVGQSYHAADASPLGADALAALPPERLGEGRVVLHPSVRLLRSAFPIVTIWSMNQAGAPVGPIEDWSGEDALVVRPALAVDVVRLPPGGFAFLEALQGDKTLGEALDAAWTEAEAFDPAAALAGLVSAGLAIRFVP